MKNTNDLVGHLTKVDGVTAAFDGPRFHEAMLMLDRAVGPVLDALAERGILGGLDLSGLFPEIGNGLLVCATETKSAGEIEAYASALAEIMREARVA
jgi:glycine dehydrogenase subunit 1